MEDTHKPVHSFRYGNVECAIWANNSQVGFFFNTTFGRVYKDGDQWGQSASFEDRDLPHLMKAAASLTVSRTGAMVPCSVGHAAKHSAPAVARG